MKYLILIIFLTQSPNLMAEDKPSPIPTVAPSTPGSCNKIAQATDTQETTLFECIRTIGQYTVYCLSMKSGLPKGSPSVSVSCIKL